jgi:4'-phosphopantetheinyl transferase EntD
MSQAHKSPFPADIAFAYARSGEEGEAKLAAEEWALLSPAAVAVRRRHFTLGRLAAHRALETAGLSRDFAVLKGERGEPIWPEGWVGTITHAGDLAAAAVAREADYVGVGLDVEELSRQVDMGITSHICLPEELPWIQGGAEEFSGRTADDNARLKMLFSAKEAVFKAFYPIEEIYLDFVDACLIYDEGSTSFRGELRKSASAEFPVGTRFDVACELQQDYIVASLFLRQSSS